MFRNAAAEFVYVRSYARWLEDKKRRETWPETVDRYISFLERERGDVVPAKVFRKTREYMLDFAVVGSMRALWAAGPAAEKDNTVMYNCSFQAINKIEAFQECIYILMCGAGYGFSVEKQYTDQLPDIPPLTSDGAGTFVVEDSKRGWADSVGKLITALYQGKDLTIDYSQIRPCGARLKTMGGRASGPQPLMLLHNFIRGSFEKAQGRKLTPLEVHDIINQIAEVVIMGGVRRSSQISLSDLNDDKMRDAKKWPFPLRRNNANNSAVYLEQPPAIEFLQEWSALAASGTGERGIFNLEAARKTAPKRRNSDLIAGTNPCCEITLREEQFCNLSEVVIRAEDDLDDLLDKIECATWLGAIQSTFTKFPYLNPNWRKNCDEERLLGVSLTGQMDHLDLLNKDSLKAMKSRTLKTARKASRLLGINLSAALTCVKPSGTVSQLVDSASGIHPRWAPYYIRRYRIASTDPLFLLLKDQKAPLSPENGQRRKDWNKAKKIYEEGGSEYSTEETEGYKDVCSIFEMDSEWSADKVTTWVVSFPVKSPKNAVCRESVSAIDQLEHYRLMQENWCEHNASCTVYVKDDEWFEVGNWVYKHWNIINGVSFFPYAGGKQEQQPYEEITKEQYDKMIKNFPKLDYKKLFIYEEKDNTQGSQELACSGDKCDI